MPTWTTGLSSRGLPGAQLRYGHGAPTASNPAKQADFDSYIDIDNARLYAVRQNGVWPTTYASLIGPAGAALLTGYGPPDNTLGHDGDIYFNGQNGSVVGPKAQGVWPQSSTSLIGPSGSPGDAGTIIYAAMGAPSDTQGKDGDFYLDTTSSVYGFYGPKKSGTWGNAVSLIGPQGKSIVGPKGDPGQAGATIIKLSNPPADEGSPGDFAYDSVHSVFYGPRGSALNQPWPMPGFSLLGPKGADSQVPGPQGAPGVDGATLRSGTSDPSNALGNNGDFYFNSTSGYLLGPKANGTWPTPGYKLVGPIGPQGPAGTTGPQGVQGPGILSGSGSPSNDLGTVGSFYIDGSAYVLYGPKSSDPTTPWSVFRNIVGPKGADGAASTVPGPQGPVGSAGPQGSSVRSGQGAPASSLGNNGDLYVDLAGGPDLYGPKANGAWPASFISLAGKKGDTGAASTVPGPMGAMGYSVQSGQGDPPSNLGQNGDLYVDTLNARLYGAKSQNAWPTSYTSLLGATGPKGDTGAAGTPGSILRYGSSAPAAGTGNNGDFYIDQTNSRLYGPKASGAWPSSFVSLVGPAGVKGDTGPQGPAGKDGTNATVPNDITANSLVVAPVSGDTNAVQIQIKNSSSQVFLVDGAGNVTAAGSLTAAGPSSLGAASVTTLSASGAASVASLSASGNASAARFVSTAPGAASSPMLQYTANNSGTAYTSGVYSENTYGQWYETVGGYLARSIIYSNTNPRDNGVGYVTHSAYSTTGTTQPAHRFYTGNGLAFQITGNSAATFAAALGVAGPLTAAGVTLSSGGVTFPDGSTLTTATVANQATYTATSAGTAAAPAHGYAGASKGAGLFFDANGNSLVSVNGAKSLYSTAASGAAAGANGWAVASTLGAGQAVLAVTGGTGSVTIDGSGALSAVSTAASGTSTAAALTISASGGKLTFGDGTSMTTAATSSGGSGGSAAQYVATSPGTASAPAYTQTNTSSTGAYFTGSGTTSALQIAANGANVATFNSTGLVLPSGGGGKVTFADGTTQSTAATGTSSGFTNYGLGYAPPAALPTATTISATPTTLVGIVAGSTTPQTFVAGPGAYLSEAFFSVTSGTNVVFELYDQTAAVSIYKYTGPSAGNSGSAGQFASTTYPLKNGNTHIWRVTGSGSAQVFVVPKYYMQLPVPMPPGVLSTFPSWQHIGAINSSTASDMRAVGDAMILYYQAKSASLLYTITVNSASSNTGSAIFYLYNATAGNTTYTVADQTGGTISLLPGQTFTTNILNLALTANSYYLARVYGSGSGTYTFTMQVAQ